MSAGGGGQPPLAVPPPALVDCFRLDLSHCDGHDLALLDDTERERAARFRFDRDRVRFVAAHAQARRLLGRHLGLDPEGLRFATTVHGKPILALAAGAPPGAQAAEGAVVFNLTHSGPVGYLAIAGCSVGIDLEQLRPFDDLQSLIENYCSPAEIAALAGLPPGSRAAGFLRVWTRKEAALKAWGTGIGAVPLDALHVGLPLPAAVAGQESLSGLVHDGTTYSDLRLLTLAGEQEVLSIAAACGAPLAVRMTGPLPT